MSLAVANAIRAQLGGAALFMLGATALVGSADALQFRIQGTRFCNSIRIVLDPTDTYTVEFWQVRGVNCAIVKSLAFVYADQLASVITSTTGLYTSMGTMGRATGSPS